VTRAAGRSFAVADALLPHGLVGAVTGEVSTPTLPYELAIAGGAALRAADPLRRAGTRRRGEPAVALGASPARGHAQSVASAAEVAAFSAEPAATAPGWITKAPAAAASGGGAVDQLSAVGWISGRAPLKVRANGRAIGIMGGTVPHGAPETEAPERTSEIRAHRCPDDAIAPSR
jgi:hypothetical protein